MSRLDDLIFWEDKERLIALVMKLTGGSANPVVVGNIIDRLRKEGEASERPAPKE